MMDYVNLLLDAINRCSEEDIDSKIKLRNLICTISENNELKSDPLVRELLYTASHKMRIFGYNIQNGFYENKENYLHKYSELAFIREQSILKRYQSKVRSKNILDKTQQNIIDFYFSLEVKRMLVSAPTSYGKTFIMREIVFLSNKRYNNVLLVFPTVALLRENAINMEELNQEKEMGYNVVKSIDGEIDVKKRNIFVFTPERALQLVANYPDIKIDFFFYDEMYKIDEDYCGDDINEIEDKSTRNNFYNNKTFLDEARAKTFRICLYILSKKVPEYYLAGPNLKKEKFGLGMRRFIFENNIKVKEIEFEPTKRIQVNAYGKKIEEDYRDLPYLEKPNPVNLREKVNDRICDVVQYIKERSYGATMLYCTTPSKANEYATKLAQNHQGKRITDPEFLMFVSHLKKTYNIEGSVNEWSFVNVLEKGFGLHHGKMPKYIQKEVLDLFNGGAFDLLFCTSTIVEGVNTNARNMVVLNHKKGTSDLTIFDFKNIIGRAGRYYHNFVGRYFLVDKELARFDIDDDLELNFITYDDLDLDVVDIDNAYITDLSEKNKKFKEKRMKDQQSYLLTDEVFIKNRLIKKEIQEALLQYLLHHDTLYYKFFSYIERPDILSQFTKYGAMSTVLDIFADANLLDKNIVMIYKAVSKTYCSEGFRGLLKYEIDNARKDKYDERGNKIKNKSVDKAYMDAFKTQKEIVEHKFPKLLALFETIYIDVSIKKNKNLEKFSLSRVIRFYETGVKSYFGEQLVEFGFPVDAIKRIEDENNGLVYMNAEISKKYVKEHLAKINDLLDDYEKILMKRALHSFL